MPELCYLVKAVDYRSVEKDIATEGLVLSCVTELARMRFAPKLPSVFMGRVPDHASCPVVQLGDIPEVTDTRISIKCYTRIQRLG